MFTVIVFLAGLACGVLGTLWVQDDFEDTEADERIRSHHEPFHGGQE
jgi:hypothetical protein